MTGKPASKRCTNAAILKAIEDLSEENYLDPSYDEIGKRIGMAKSGVCRRVKRLEKSGMLTRIDGKCRSLRTVKPVQLAFEFAREIIDKMVEIPIRGVISAGHPIVLPHDAGFDRYSTTSIRSNMIPPRINIEDLFALKVIGDSMVDAYIHDGDIVIMQRIEIPEHGDMVAAWLPKISAITLKRFKREEKGISLQPANKLYDPIFINNPEDILIQGKVIAVQRLI